MMKFKQLKAMNQKELNDKLVELNLELMKLRSQVAIGTSPENPGKIRSIKKTIARINTTINQKEVTVKKA